MFSLRRFLIDYDMAMLRALAHSRGVTLETNLQPEAVEQLAPALLDPLSVRVALARLSPAARAALEAVQAAGGRQRAPQFARAHGQIRPVGPGRLEREGLWQNPANAAEELWYAGLLCRGFVQEQGAPVEFVFVPDDLLPLLPAPPAGEGPAFVLDIVPPPGTELAAGQDQRVALVADLFAYLVYIHNHDVRVYADGRLGRHHLAALSQRLVATGAQRRFSLVRRLAERLGLVVSQGDVLRLEPAAARHWLAAAPPEQLAALQVAWRDDPGWLDLCHVPALACDPATGWLQRYDPVAVRQALLALLAHCPPGAWWTLPSFVAAVKVAHPDFQRPDGDYAAWYIRDAASGDYLSGFASWDAVEGRLIADLLTGALAWLGVVRRITTSKTTICSLPEAGQRFLGLASQEAAGPPGPAPAPSIAVQPDFGVEVPAPPNLYTRFQLERFADLERETPCLYRLSGPALSRALGRGVQVEQVLAFLNQASGGRLPANVAGQLRLWAGRFGQVEVEEMVLLRARSERAMKELAVLPETRPLIVRLLSPTAALVRRQDLGRLRRVLRELGFLPPGAGEEDADEPQQRG